MKAYKGWVNSNGNENCCVSGPTAWTRALNEDKEFNFNSHSFQSFHKQMNFNLHLESSHQLKLFNWKTLAKTFTWIEYFLLHVLTNLNSFPFLIYSFRFQHGEINAKGILKFATWLFNIVTSKGFFSHDVISELFMLKFLFFSTK